MWWRHSPTTVPGGLLEWTEWGSNAAPSSIARALRPWWPAVPWPSWPSWAGSPAKPRLTFDQNVRMGLPTKNWFLRFKASVFGFFSALYTLMLFDCHKMVILDWPTRNLGYLRRYCRYLGMGRNDWTPKMDCWMQLWMDTDGDDIMVINGDQWWLMDLPSGDQTCLAGKKNKHFSSMIVSAGNLHLVQGFPSPCQYPGYGIMTLLPWCSNQIAGIKKGTFPVPTTY